MGHDLLEIGQYAKVRESDFCSNRAPMYQPVYQHHTEDYQQPYMNEEFSNYFGIQNSLHEINSQTWTESDYL